MTQVALGGQKQLWEHTLLNFFSHFEHTIISAETNAHRRLLPVLSRGDVAECTFVRRRSRKGAQQAQQTH